jgi:hypothetical protein
MADASALALAPLGPVPPPPPYGPAERLWVERQLRGHVPRWVSIVRPEPKPVRLAHTGQEDASPPPSPRSVDVIRHEPGESPLQRRDDNAWLWIRRPRLAMRYLRLRRTRSCPVRLTMWYYG